MQDGCHGRHLENLFFASSPQPKGQLTPNLLGSIKVTCRSKIAKIVPIGIQDGRHLENQFFAPKPKSQLTPNLVGGIGVTYRSKIAKIVPIGNPRWPPYQPSWKAIFRFFSWTKRPVDSKLGRKHRGDLYISKIAKIMPIVKPGWAPWQPSWKSIFRFFSWT